MLISHGSACSAEGGTRDSPFWAMIVLVPGVQKNLTGIWQASWCGLTYL